MLGILERKEKQKSIKETKECPQRTCVSRLKGSFKAGLSDSTEINTKEHHCEIPQHYWKREKVLKVSRKKQQVTDKSTVCVINSNIGTQKIIQNREQN